MKIHSCRSQNNFIRRSLSPKVDWQVIKLLLANSASFGALLAYNMKHETDKSITGCKQICNNYSLGSYNVVYRSANL